VKKEWGSHLHLFKLLEEKITSMEFARKDGVDRLLPYGNDVERRTHR
jgi:hypothetical protein